MRYRWHQSLWLLLSEIFIQSHAQPVDNIVINLVNEMIDITLDTVEYDLKFQDEEEGKILYIYELGETEDRTKAVVITAPYQVVFVDTLPGGRGPEDDLIIRDLMVLVDSRLILNESESAENMTNYMAR